MHYKTEEVDNITTTVGWLINNKEMVGNTLLITDNKTSVHRGSKDTPSGNDLSNDRAPGDGGETANDGGHKGKDADHIDDDDSNDSDEILKMSDDKSEESDDSLVLMRASKGIKTILKCRLTNRMMKMTPSLLMMMITMRGRKMTTTKTTIMMHKMTMTSKKGRGQ